MAPKPVDNSVNERRLRPIYDWLDNGNNKKALQEAEKVLKKQPALQCAKALKALAMIRLGKSEEAHHVLREVHSEEPCEDATLQAMAICYRETHRPELTCQAYEAAVKKDPTNEEFLSHLFMAHVRVGDYRKQQQAAMALFKVKPKNPYYFWAVMSILMQAHGNSLEDISLTVTLPLAERMIKKFVDENKIEAEAEVQLYLMVLEKEKKFKEALDVLEGPLAQKHLSPSMLETKKGDYLRELKQWDRVLDHYEELLRFDPDQWSHYVGYVEAIFESQEEQVLSIIGRGKEFLFSLATRKDANILRGPYLARLHLWQQLDQKKFDASTLFGDFREFVEDYIQVLGDKPCAFQDLRPFIQSLRSSQVDELLACSGRLVDMEDGQSPSTVKQLCRHLLHIQLSRYLGRHDSLSEKEKIELSDQLWLTYQRTKIFNVGLLTTDFRPNDGYALLAAHLLLDVWNNDPAILDKCLVLLETALSQSPANYHLKLLTTRVYTLAGHGRAAVQRYETLDVKYIQLDSLGHLLCRPLISMGLPQTASPLLSSTLRFYTTHARETSECLISAYKFGSFGKIPEFTRFGRRLDGSHHFASSTAERMLLDLLMESGNNQIGLVQTASGMHADPHQDQLDWNGPGGGCVDNRDCAIFVSWDPPSKQVGEKEVVKKTFDGEVKFARLRNRLVHALIATVSLSPDWPTNGVLPEVKNGSHQDSADGVKEEKVNGKNLRVLSELLTEISELQTQYEKNKESIFIPHSQFSVQSPPPPRLYTYVADGCLEPLLVLMHFAVEVCSGTSLCHSSDSTVVRFERSISHIIQSARQPIAGQSFWRNYIHLERIYNAVETLCLSVLVLSTIHSVFKSGKNSTASKKKNKKKATEVKGDSNPSSNDMAEQLKSVIRCASSSLRELDLILDELNVLQTAFNHLKVTDDSEASAIVLDIKKKLGALPGSEMKAMLSDKKKLLESCCH